MSFHSKKPRKATDSRIRIIGGQWRGRKLPVIDADGLRPTGDRIRETLFNWLTAEVHDATVLDLFAGTGALGLEALSRGAKQVTFVEQHPAAFTQLQSNLHLLGAKQAKLLHADALLVLSEPPNHPVDLLFMDPPFDRNLWQAVIDKVTQNSWLHDNSMVYIETPKNTLLTLPPTWHLHREKSAGQICARLYTISC